MSNVCGLVAGGASLKIIDLNISLRIKRQQNSAVKYLLKSRLRLHTDVNDAQLSLACGIRMPREFC